MAAVIREKFSSQAAPEVLAALRHIAESEGRQFQAVLDEALCEYIERKEKGRPRRLFWMPSRKAWVGTITYAANLPNRFNLNRLIELG